MRHIAQPKIVIRTMARKMLLTALLFACSAGSEETVPDHDLQDCHMKMTCGDWSQDLPMMVRGLPGSRGQRGSPGTHGVEGRRGFVGPPGRDGYQERSTSFYVELPRLFIATNLTGTLRPWKVDRSLNAPGVADYFSADTGIFTVPNKGLYQFFLTVAVSRAQALVYIAKNDKHICPIRIASIATAYNETVAWGWASGSLDCLMYCHPGDQISVVGSNEHFDSQIYGYSYSTFSGYILHNN